MQKTTNILITMTFTIGCLGFWLVVVLFQSIYPLQQYYALPNFTRFIVEGKMFFLIFPIPFLLFSIVLALTKQPKTDFNLLYLSILTITFAFLCFSVVAAVGLPWIRRID